MNVDFSTGHIDLVFHLEMGIKENEFELYFQPIIHTISGSLCGFESLVRWRHPLYGFLNPNQFIPALEETKQIHHLDIHVVEMLCQWYREETQAGRPVVPVSVNLSRVDFESADMFSIIERLTNQYGMPRNMLNIEVTESAFSENWEFMSNEIRKFRAAGYQVWMDDFGSGYSSLNTLKDYEFDELKIDMGFLSNMSLRSKRIITSIISMAKNIRMVTLVEGVETVEQVEFLRRVGCDRMQGFYFSKPLPYQGVLKTLREKNIPFETEDDRRYYHEINRVNLLSASPFNIREAAREAHGGGIPLAIMEKRGDIYEFIYQNEEFSDDLDLIGAADAMDAIQRLVHFGILTMEEIDTFIDDTIEKGERNRDFSVNGNLCSAHAKLISSSGGRYAILLSINNITQTMNISHEQLMDQTLVTIYKLYLRVTILRLESGELITVFSQDHHDIATDTPYEMKTFLKEYADNEVYPDDHALYMEFLDPQTLSERISHSDRGFINVKIRTRDRDGSYSYKMYLAVAKNGREVLLLVRYANL